jgi:hypothetical protein
MSISTPPPSERRRVNQNSIHNKAGGIDSATGQDCTRMPDSRTQNSKAPCDAYWFSLNKHEDFIVSEEDQCDYQTIPAQAGHDSLRADRIMNDSVSFSRHDRLPFMVRRGCAFLDRFAFRVGGAIAALVLSGAHPS